MLFAFIVVGGLLGLIGLIVQSAGATPATSIDLGTFPSGPLGFRIRGDAESYLGRSIAQLGDFNDDGINDYIIGVPGNGGFAGVALILFGNTAMVDIDLDTFSSGPSGFKVIGYDRTIWRSGITFTGSSVGSAGDINDDGRADALVADGAITTDGANDNRGAVRVLFGRAGPFADIFLATFTAGDLGFTIYGYVDVTGQFNMNTCALGDGKA